MPIRKKIKFDNKQFNIGVYTYYNGRMRLKYENKNECHDITLNLKNDYIEDGKIFLDPAIMQNGLIYVLKRNRIIKEITGFSYFNNIEVPIARVNMGKLREFDKYGVKKHLREKVDCL